MSSKLELIVKEQKLSEDTGLALVDSIRVFLDTANKWSSSIEAIEVGDVKDKASMKLARESRLYVRQQRLDALELVGKKRAEIKLKKLVFDQEDGAWLKAGKLVEEVCKGIEEKALEKEKFAEREAARIAEELRAERWDILSAYFEFEPKGLGELPQEEFEKILRGAEEAERAKAKAEEERLERERIEKLGATRFARLAPLAPWIEGFGNIRFGELSAEEFKSIGLRAIGEREAAEAREKVLRERRSRISPYAQYVKVEIEDLSDEEFENVMLVAKNKHEKAEKDRKQVEEDLRVEREAREKAEAAADKLKKAEEKRKQEELAEQRRKDAEKKRLEEEAKAKSVKQLFREEIEGLELKADFRSVDTEDIYMKFEGFKKWALNQLKDEKV